MKVAAFHTICWLQSNEPELSMRDRLRKRIHYWLGIDRVTHANRARNTANVVKSGKKLVLFFIIESACEIIKF